MYETYWCNDNGSEYQVRMTYDIQPYEPETLETPAVPAEVTIGDVERLEPIHIGGINTGDEHWVLWEGVEDGDIEQWETEIMEVGQ